MTDKQKAQLTESFGKPKGGHTSHTIHTPLGFPVEMFTKEELRAAVVAEREACAQIAFDLLVDGCAGPYQVAAAIRART